MTVEEFFEKLREGDLAYCDFILRKFYVAERRNLLVDCSIMAIRLGDFKVIDIINENYSNLTSDVLARCLSKNSYNLDVFFKYFPYSTYSWFYSICGYLANSDFSVSDRLKVLNYVCHFNAQSVSNYDLEFYNRMRMVILRNR